jgi:hypothetical protein
MTMEKLIKEIEKLIAECQQIQMVNPPSSEQWQEASVEINRLAKLIVAGQAISEGKTLGTFLRAFPSKTKAQYEELQAYSYAYIQMRGGK